MTKLSPLTLCFPVSALFLSSSAALAHVNSSNLRNDAVDASNSCGFAERTTFSGDATNYSSEDEIDNQSRIVGGKVSATCAWPATAHMGTKAGASCTGTLVTPKVIAFAAHCMANGSPSSWTFGERSPWKKTVQVQSCKKNPKFTGNNLGQGVDFAYCVLREPVTDIPPIPIAMGCELDHIKAQTPVVPVGFGATAGKSQGSPGGGTKREVETVAQGAASGGLITIGTNGKGSCHGDSGGPLYVQLPKEIDPDQSWRAIGATSYGPSATECPGKTFYSYLPHSEGVAWIEKTSGLDITPCHDADGTWNPGPECGKFHKEPGNPMGATWANGCAPTSFTGMSSTCGPPFGEPDEDPTGSIKDPKDGDKFDDSEKITVSVDAKDDSAVASVELFVDGTSEGKKTAEPYEWEIGPLDIGEHKLKATITDDKDKTAETDEIEIEVEEASDETSTGDDDDDTTTTGDDDDDDTTTGDGDGDDDDDDDDDSTADDDDDSADDDDDDDDNDDDDDDSAADDDDDDSAADDDDDDESSAGEEDSGPDANSHSGGCQVAPTSGASPMTLMSLFGFFGLLRSRRMRRPSNR